MLVKGARSIVSTVLLRFVQLFSDKILTKRTCACRNTSTRWYTCIVSCFTNWKKINLKFSQTAEMTSAQQYFTRFTFQVLECLTRLHRPLCMMFLLTKMYSNLLMLTVECLTHYEPKILWGHHVHVKIIGGLVLRAKSLFSQFLFHNAWVIHNNTEQIIYHNFEEFG